MTLAKNPACNPSCGACHYKAFTYGEQLRRKQQWALEQLAPWKDLLQQIQAAPAEERLAYRSKTWLRSSFSNGTLSFGMYRAQKFEGSWRQEFVSWDTCPIHVLPIKKMIERLQTTLVRHARGFSEKSLLGIWLGSPHAVVVAKERTGTAITTVPWNEILEPPFDRVWLHETKQVGRKIFQHRKFDPLFGPPGNDEGPILAFRQVAQSLLVQARELAISSLLAARPGLVVDLYCGTGELSQRLPPSVGWLGIERSVNAATYAGRIQRNGGAIHEAFTGTVEQRLLDPRVEKKINGVYSLFINPPRPGMSRDAQDRVTALIREKPPSRIAYLSCSASSLARDLRLIENEGFQVTQLQPYDFFPQTEHFETLALMEREQS